jgi:protein gp37
MGDHSDIEWTDATWNPVTGCTRVSPGCDNCYAARAAATRLKNTPQYRGLAVVTPSGRAAFNGTVRLLPERLEEPLHWRRPRRVFVNSMSDLFHEQIPDEFILSVFDVMRQCTWSGGQGCGRIAGDGHTFQVLTKRPERMLDFMSRLRWNGNGLVLDAAPTWKAPLTMMRQIWLGVSVEDQQRADERIPLLLQTPAAVRFISAEPLLGPVDLMGDPDPVRRWLKGGYREARGVLTDRWRPGLDWVIVGGESGPGARPMDVAWARSIVAQCKAAGVSCFVKQLGARSFDTDPLRSGRWPKATRVSRRDPDGCPHIFDLTLSDRKGGDPSEWPEDLRVREWPRAGVGA